jgi:LacI family transcriptional regulator
MEVAMASMVDVARVAGVSVSTVSHVVNGTRKVEPDTRARVEAAIRETGYRQDALARAMRRSRTDSVGLIVSDPGEPAFAEMVRGVEREAASIGLTLLLANSAEDPDKELRAIEVLLARRVDGIILARSSGSTDQVLDELKRGDMPLVLLDRLYDVDLDQVGVQNAPAMAELVAHLANGGHRRIGLVAGDLGVPTLQERHAGYLDGLQACGLPHEQSLVLTGDVQVEEAYRDTLSMLTSDDPPTALVACSTILAAGALQAVKELSLEMPTDLAFATFDGFAYSDLFEPSLTTVRQPAFEVGAEALRLLVNRIAEPESPPTQARLQPRIEYRRSTEPAVG